jgi:outer membrane receptor for ferrienterochelin and colicin
MMMMTAAAKKQKNPGGVRMATRALCRVAPLCVGFGMGGFAYPAFADDDPEKKSRERIEVTGSHIRRVDLEGPAPVLVITREQIDRSGVSDVAALLRELPVIAGGGVTDFNAALGFQRGNQAVSLRGLGPVATLVLLNGRRMPVAPYADPGTAYGNSFNLNVIPLSAIERIEVLKDGASAIYGSDAIAGVVNVILRKDFRGAEATWSHWQQLDNFDQMNYPRRAAFGRDWLRGPRARQFQRDVRRGLLQALSAGFVRIGKWRSQ